MILLLKNKRTNENEDNGALQLNLMFSEKLSEMLSSMSRGVFIMSIIFSILITTIPLYTLATINKNLKLQEQIIQAQYNQLKAKEKQYNELAHEKETLTNYLQNTEVLFSMEPSVSTVLKEILKRFPSHSKIVNNMTLNTNKDHIFTTLQVETTNELDVPTLLESFAKSPYLDVVQTKIVPMSIPTLQQSKEHSYRYTVQLVLSWHPTRKAKLQNNKNNTDNKNNTEKNK